MFIFIGTKKMGYVVYLANGMKKGIGITAAIITGAVIGAGTAAISGAVSGSAASKAAEQQAEAQQQQLAMQQEAAAKQEAKGEEAISIQEQAAAERKAALAGIKLPTALETPEGQLLKGTLEERIAGRVPTPAAEQRKANLAQEQAYLGAQTSAKGLGRSTLGLKIGQEAGSQANRDIMIMKAQQTKDALESYQQLTGRNLDDLQRQAYFEADKVLAEESGQVGIANTLSGNAAIEKNNAFAISDTIAAKGASEAAWTLKQAAIQSAAIQQAGISLAGAFTQSNKDLADQIQQNKQTRLGAQVNIGQVPESGGAGATRGLGIGFG